MGKHEEAFERLEEAHDILKKNEGPDSEKAAMVQSEMGILHKKLGQFDKVLKALIIQFLYEFVTFVTFVTFVKILLNVGIRGCF